MKKVGGIFDKHILRGWLFGAEARFPAWDQRVSWNHHIVDRSMT